MVDNMPINVITCDPKTFEIDYVNQASIKTSQTLEHLLPIKAVDLMGQCIDVFHKDPSMQRRILGDPRNLPHKANIKVGDETLALDVSAIMDKKGEYLGPMLTWTVITEQIRIAGRVEEVVEVVAAASSEMEATA